MPAPLELLPKLLALACGGGPDGEVLAAVSRIRALLIAQDLSWNQLLANGTAASLTEEQMAKVFQAGMMKGEALGYERGLVDGRTMPGTPIKNPSIEIADDITWISNVLDAAEKAEAAQHLDTFEVDFSTSMRATMLRFGRHTYVTQRQFDSLKRLEQALRRRGYL